MDVTERLEPVSLYLGMPLRPYLRNQPVQSVVDYAHVLFELALTRHDTRRERDVPVREVERASVRGFLKTGVHGFNNRALPCRRSEVVVEHR